MSIKEENDLLKMINEMQASRIAEQEETIKELRAMVNELRSLKVGLEETLDEFRRKVFGVSSEKTKKKTETESTHEEKETVTVKSHVRERKPKATREEQYGNLPIREVICPVPESERFCDWCNTEMVSMKYNFVREEIRITPAIIERIHYLQEVMICPTCKKDHDGSFKKGEIPNGLLAHSPASASAIAYTIFNKCFMGLPYYRQSSALEQLGATIPRETLANWCILATEKHLFPIYERLHQELLKREVIHADETTCQVLKEEGRLATATSYMWIYASGTDGLPGIVMYEYQSGRGGVYPHNFLQGFQGLLQCDGYTGYNKVDDVLLACCMAHCRRKFYEALPAARKKNLKLLDINSEEALKEPIIPEKDIERYIPAEIGVAYCNKLFYLEREWKTLCAEERKANRLAKEVPIWDGFLKWVDSLNPTKGSKLEKAVNYTKNHRDSLRTYLQDGRCELSNNTAERKAKSYAVGRKASLFHASVAGANTSAILYSLVETAKANKLNVFQYIYTLLLYMPGYQNESEGIEQLLPWSDFIKEHCSGLIDVETMTVENHPTLSV